MVGICQPSRVTQLSLVGAHNSSQKRPGSTLGQAAVAAWQKQAAFKNGGFAFSSEAAYCKSLYHMTHDVIFNLKF